MESKRLKGIYYLMEGESIVYIGSSYNVEDRVKQHYDKQFGYVEFTESDLDRGDLYELEKELIRKHKPKYNKNLYPIRSKMILWTDPNLIGRLDREALKQGVSRNELVTNILEREVK